MPKTKNEIIRITVSVPIEHHDELEILAEKNKVSAAWVACDAIVADSINKTNNN